MTIDRRTYELKSYWQNVSDEVAALKRGGVESEVMELHSDEKTVTHGLRFEGIEGYPLFAYYSRPRDGGPFIPLFQTPGYGSVVTVPAVERRTRYAVLALCHRGQRLSNRHYQAAYPGLLTDGLPGAGSYVWRAVVADCLRAIDLLLEQSDVDVDNLALAGNDLTALLAVLRPDAKSALAVTPLIFTGLADRAGQTNAYPLQEVNDFRRCCPDDWAETRATLDLFDPAQQLGKIGANTMVACTAGEKEAAGALAQRVSGEAEVYVNTGYGFIDHKVHEDWLSKATGAPVSDGPFLPRG